MKKRKFDVGECSHSIERRSSDDPILESKHKIFLSHSGVQKEFVAHLCQALEARCHYPFFDRRRESLPKGKEFSSLIVKAAQQCQLLVVVVSEDYFMSKWPMIELNAFVQANKVLNSNVNVAILPLFYGLSVSDLKDEKRRQRWFQRWKTFAMDDRVEGRIKLEDWRYALDELTKFNGLSYDRELKEIVAYENEIVSHICTLVLPDIKWNDSHVQGNAHEALLDKMKEIGFSQKYKVKVVGIYGVGGIGKSTTCKKLCNALSNEYGGCVCHVEFESTCSNSKELLQNAVINLTRRSVDFVCQLGEGECKDVLHKNLRNRRTFLAMDNVWDNFNSIKQAKMFLELPFHEDSLVLVTARSQSTLSLWGIDGDACLEMPELGLGDATSLFLYYAAPCEQFTSREDMNSIGWCVWKCYFCKGDGRGYHYHPLALEALGRQLCGFKEKPSKWVQRISRVWKFSSISGEDIVFDVLRSSFDLLQPIEQALFMDVGFFLRGIKKYLLYDWRDWINLKDQLCVLYKRDEFEIQSQLDSLKQKGLLQDVDLTSGRIHMHDLYHEFVTREAVGKFGGALAMRDRKWLFVDGDDGDLSELEVTPAGGCWEKLSRLSIRQKEERIWDHLRPNYGVPSNSITRLFVDGDDGYLSELEVTPASECWEKLSQLSIWEKEERIWDHLRPNYGPPTNPITSLEGIEWQYFSNVLVLQLYGLKWVHGGLNLKGMKCLRILQLFDLRCMKRLEGLESLKHLTYFGWKTFLLDDIKTTHVVGQFPASLRYLDMDGECVLSGSNVFARCINLIKLKLKQVEVGVQLNLSNCLSLEGVEIFTSGSLQTLSGLSAKGLSRLQALKIIGIEANHILGLEEHHGLVQLSLVSYKHSWEVLCLLSLTKLRTLKISTHTKLAVHCIPHQLQELYYEYWTKCEAPCLNAFKHLQVLDLCASKSLIRMDGLGDLPALRACNLFRCENLKRLPDLRKSKSLEKLNLDYCHRLKLHEKDFEMLATLPLLHPVQFSGDFDRKKMRLDIVGQKVLLYMGPAKYGLDSWLAWEKGEWEELELGLPPIGIGTRGIWDTHEIY